jgi:hypothetical protein
LTIKKGTPDYIINIRANARRIACGFSARKQPFIFSNDAKENKVKGMQMRRQIFKQL